MEPCHLGLWQPLQSGELRVLGLSFVCLGAFEWPMVLQGMRIFNDFLWDHKKYEGREIPHSHPRYLQEFTSWMKLFDLIFNGPKFTWRGTRNNSLVQERLDRGLVNESWQERWPNTTVIHETIRASNHCSVVINFDPAPPRGKKIFWFESFLLEEEGCHEIIEKCWPIHCEGNLMCRVDCWTGVEGNSKKAWWKLMISV